MKLDGLWGGELECACSGSFTRTEIDVHNEEETIEAKPQHW